MNRQMKRQNYMIWRQKLLIISQENDNIKNDDKIKIQKVLKFVENYLKRLYPKSNVFPIILWLRYRCLREKSDEPIEKVSS